MLLQNLDLRVNMYIAFADVRVTCGLCTNAPTHFDRCWISMCALLISLILWYRWYSNRPPLLTKLFSGVSKDTQLFPLKFIGINVIFWLCPLLYRDFSRFSDSIKDVVPTDGEKRRTFTSSLLLKGSASLGCSFCTQLLVHDYWPVAKLT